MPNYFDYSTKYTVPLSFVNNSTHNLTLQSSEIDCYDFSGNETPDQYNGAVLAAGTKSEAFDLLARRTCAYVSGDIIGKFQEREARWKTTVSTTGTQQAGDLPTGITCSSHGQFPTMCVSGSRQETASYTVPLGSDEALRASFKCDRNTNNVTVTFTDLY